MAIPAAAALHHNAALGRLQVGAVQLHDARVAAERRVHEQFLLARAQLRRRGVRENLDGDLSTSPRSGDDLAERAARELLPELETWPASARLPETEAARTPPLAAACMPWPAARTPPAPTAQPAPAGTACQSAALHISRVAATPPPRRPQSPPRRPRSRPRSSPSLERRASRMKRSGRCVRNSRSSLLSKQ
eukprot:scaffold13909_cov63-Phaeocystis_antarctica.AAC.2